MSLILGITGPSGSGKSSVSALLGNMGAIVVDADKIAHEVLFLDSVKNEIRTEFGDVFTDGEIDRKKLGAIVFADPEKLKLLNLITHHHVVDRAKEIIAENPDAEMIVIDAIGLKESGLDLLCKYTIAIIAPREMRIERIIARDNITREAALSRVNAQKKDSEFTVGADFVILNNSDPETLNARMIEIFDSLRG